MPAVPEVAEVSALKGPWLIFICPLNSLTRLLGDRKNSTISLNLMVKAKAHVSFSKEPSVTHTEAFNQPEQESRQPFKRN